MLPPLTFVPIFNESSMIFFLCLFAYGFTKMSSTPKQRKRLFPTNNSYCVEENGCGSTDPEWIPWRAAGRRWTVVPGSWGGFHWSLLHTAHNSSGLNRRLRTHSELCPRPPPTVPPGRSLPATTKQKMDVIFAGTCLFNSALRTNRRSHMLPC